jgi:hypothetical protein
LFADLFLTHRQELSMLDLLYIFLGLVVFAAFAFGIRAAERL